jgi:hypothetical protein
MKRQPFSAFRPIIVTIGLCGTLLAGCSSGKDSTGPTGTNKAPTIALSAPANNATFTIAQAIDVTTEISALPVAP